MQYSWVLGRYEGDTAKRILAEANAGVGHKIMEQGRAGGGLWVLAAFIRADDSPIPEHLTKIVEPNRVAKLEEWRNRQ